MKLTNDILNRVEISRGTVGPNRLQDGADGILQYIQLMDRFEIPLLRKQLCALNNNLFQSKLEVVSI